MRTQKLRCFLQFGSGSIKEVQSLPDFRWLGNDGKVTLYDGRTGAPFDRAVLVGRQYMLKLNQLVLHKINARSGLGGPYAAVTQQPVGGKANHGGQRMGEMEVWAIQSYGAANVLQEMMTVKADDIEGRHQAYADIVQGRNISSGGRTAAFDGLCCEIRGLGFEVTLGKIVDTFEPIESKSCSVPGANTLEKQFMVSRVDKLEKNDGTKMLEIPAGDYEPPTMPTITPILPPLVYGKRSQQSNDLLQTALIEDVDDAEDKDFTPVETTYERLEKVLENGFPSSDNWETLANDLININSDGEAQKTNTSTLTKRLESFIDDLSTTIDKKR